MEKPTPIEILGRFSPIAAQTYMHQRAEVMENQEAQALPPKVKLLIGIGVAAALQSSMCTLMWCKQARKAGVSDSEIAEAIMVTRLMKSAVVNDAFEAAVQWLLENPSS